MTEDRELHDVDEPADEPVAAPTGEVRTGVDRIDAVIAAVEQLEDRPIEEHVGVFENAHEHLRRALDNQPPPS